MHFKSLCAFVALILPVAVIASPVADVCRILRSTDFVKMSYLYLQVSNGLMDLHARAFRLRIEPTPGGDYNKLLQPRPNDVPEPDKATCPNYKQALANWRKNSKACFTYDSMRVEFNTAIIPSVTRVLNAAEGALLITGLDIVAHIKGSFHASDPKTDLKEHWTFTFAAPACGHAGQVCTGHAYDPDLAPIGRIWSANHVELYHGCKWSQKHSELKSVRLTDLSPRIDLNLFCQMI